MRRAFVSPEYRLAVYWSPKCGCTTIASWFAYGLLGLGQDEGSRARAWLGRTGRTLKDEDVLSIPANYHTVAVTREPLSRAISAFTERFVVHRSGPILRGDQLSSQARALYRQLRGKDPVTGSYQGLSFVEFLTGIGQLINGRGEREPKLDHHWNTQAAFRWLEEGIRPSQTFDIKALNQCIAELSERYGVAFQLRNRNVTRYGAGADTDASNVNSIALAQSPAMPSSRQFISEETIALAASAYAIDYEAFGYDRPVAR